MIQISDKDLKQAVEKAVLLLGHNAKTTELIDNLRKQLTQLFNKNNIEVLINNHEVKNMATKTFQWTDELVKEWSDHVRVIFNNRNNYCGKYASFDIDFDKWKEEKMKPPEPTWEIVGYCGDMDSFGLKCVLVQKLPDGKWFLDYRLGRNEPFDISTVPTDRLKIYSIKRLKDEETFTIGEMVYSKMQSKNQCFKVSDIQQIDTVIYLDSCPLDNAIKI